MRRTLLTLVILCLGCTKGPAPTTQVPLSEVPQPTLHAAQKALPKVKLEHARRVKFRGEEVTEIRGKLPNGKIREVKISDNGTVVEVN